VNSNEVFAGVIARVEELRALHEAEPTDPVFYRDSFSLNQEIYHRDAEYIVECMCMLLQDETFARRMVLLLDNDGFSDAAIAVFCGFLRLTTCHFRALWLRDLPPRQTRRLLEALHTNRSV
jgi:hypothetical protein